MSSQYSLLLIEDEPEFLEILSRRFTRRGFDVVGAGTMQEAAAAASDRNFNVVMMDRTLRGLDCLDLMPRLKASLPEVRVLILSGRSDAVSVAQAMAAGAHAYLKKPCSLADIEQALLGACASQPSQQFEKAPQNSGLCSTSCD